MPKTKKKDQKKKSFRKLLWKETSTLITAALSLVAALAWNDAIQSLFQELLGVAGSLYAKFLYAILVTILSVFLVIRLTKLSDQINGSDDEEK